MSTMDLYSFTTEVGKKKIMTNLLLEATPELTFQQLIEGIKYGKRQGTEHIQVKFQMELQGYMLVNLRETLICKKP